MSETPLCALARKYGTDKGGRHIKYPSGRCHNYTPTYYDMWKARRLESLTILEIGVQDGRSIQMWRDFFPHAQIYGWDIDTQQYAYPEDQYIKIMRVPLGRFHDWVVTEADEAPIRAALDAEGSPIFDFIIDDGSHCDAQQQLAVDVLLPYLHINGIFCIEDHDTLQPPDTFVDVPSGFSREILLNRDPHPDSLLQVIRHV